MIELRNAYKTLDGDKILYQLMRERSGEDDQYINISHRTLPTWDNHKKFMRSRPYRRWYLIKVDELFVGSLTLSRNNEIGIVLFREHRGKGYGLNAVAALIEKHKPLAAIPGKRGGSFIANINPKNEHSLRMFKKLGFTEKQVTLEL